MTRKGSDYIPATKIPDEWRARYQLILAAATGAIEVTEAARRLGMSRVRLQTVMHRATKAFAEAVIPHPAGRPPKSERELELEARVAQLEKANRALSEQVQMAENLFGAAGEMLRSLREGRRSARRPKTAAAKKPEDPEPQAATPETPSPRSRPRWPSWSRAIWKETIEMRRRWKAGRQIGAALLGVTASTLRRWRATGRTEPPPRRRAVEPPPEAVAAVERLVRATHGLAGAEALAHAVEGISRRQAARVKAAVRTAMERERQAACADVAVAEPGIVRGFDAMHVETTEGRWYVLACADSAVPYRTTLHVVPSYDGTAVAAVLAADIAAHGAPLAYRLDRASCHGVPDVLALLERHGVLALHGPPHHPWYYGQLERQNREHRAWLAGLGVLPPPQLQAAVAQMQHALNALWPRRTLDWQTAEGAWQARSPIVEDREALRREVADRADRLRATGDLAGRPVFTAERIATEVALQRRGYLSIQTGGRC